MHGVKPEPHYREKKDRKEFYVKGKNTGLFLEGV